MTKSNPQAVLPWTRDYPVRCAAGTHPPTELPTIGRRWWTRGMEVSHMTIFRWVQRYAIGQGCWPHLHPAKRFWSDKLIEVMWETKAIVSSRWFGWQYLRLSANSHGRRETVFPQAVECGLHLQEPRVIVAASSQNINESKKGRVVWASGIAVTNKYLWITELKQDHHLFKD